MRHATNQCASESSDKVQTKDAIHATPLSYKDTVRSWSKALIKTYVTKDQASWQVQREFKECETDIVNVVGKAAYQHILLEYQRVLAKQLVNKNITRELVSLFFLQDLVMLRVYISLTVNSLRLPTNLKFFNQCLRPHLLDDYRRARVALECEMRTRSMIVL